MNEHTSQVQAAPSETEPSSQEQPGESPEPGRQPAPERTTLLQRFGALFRPRNGNSLREDLTDALSEAADAAEFSPGERAMLHNILRLREVRVEDVMVPRAEVEAVDISTELGELLRIFEESGHSRLPVYSETLDDPRGMVHIRDVVGQVLRMSREPRRGRGQKKTANSQPLEVDLLRQLRADGHIILVSTHDLGAVPGFCDQVVIINRTVLAAGPTQETFTAENLGLAFGGALRSLRVDHTDTPGSKIHELRVITDDEGALVLREDGRLSRATREDSRDA